MFLSLFALSFGFTLWSVGTAKSIIWQVFSHFCLITRSSRLVEIRWSICCSESQIILCVSFSRTDYELGMYHLLVWSNSNLVLNSQFLAFPNLLCLVLYSFCQGPLFRMFIIIIIPLEFFHISVCWWSSTGVWVTASLFKSPGLVSGFWPFSAMLSFG